MKAWLIPAVILIVLLLALSASSRAIAASTGRTMTIEGPWKFVVPLGTGAAAACVSLLLDPPLPWLSFSAGAAAGILGLFAQLGSGRRVV